MLQPMWVLSDSDLATIHSATVELLKSTGIQFLSEESIELFRHHGFRVEGETVFFTEEDIDSALKLCPPSFTIHARNPERSVEIGGRRPIFSPIYGAPYVVDFEGNIRSGTLEDYQTLVRLAHQLPNQDMVGYLLCDPGDVPAGKANGHMLHASMPCSDKPFMGSSTHGSRGVEDCMRMGEIFFDSSRAYLREHPFCISLINSLTPLRYEKGSCEALMAFARDRQPLLIASLVTGGATGPITMAGVLVLQNAEILAGIVLAQLVSPGTPVVYGCASGIMDMRSIVVSLGAPEFSKILRAGVQLGHHYGLPCRGGGSLTESCDIDAQAGFESMSTMLNAMAYGADFIQHSAGCLSSYLAASFSKLVMDDGICSYGKAMREKVDFSEEALAIDIIKEVGHGGEYLTHLHTAMNCRSAVWQPAYSYRGGLNAWEASGKPDIREAIRERGKQLLAEYVQPDLEPRIRERLEAFVLAYKA